jgi:3-hydroxybutyrate dehydrogenase
VLTPLVEKQLRDRAAATGITYEQAMHDMLTEKQPMSKFTTPAQIGGLAVFLCSDAAATITGAPMSIDGGWVAQ